jgi:menaquinone-9 beta-reductase
VVRGELHDAVVVGAGPAGAAIAARLARRGHRVLLLDRESFPRLKPCGDCVNPAAVRELAELGALHAVRAEPHATLAGWTVVPPAGPTAAFRGTFPAGSEGIAIARERLDRVLLEHACQNGVEVRTGVKVTDVVRGCGGAVEGVRLAGGSELRAPLVVGADGLRSVVLRRLRLVRRPPRLRKLALTARVAGFDCPIDRGELHVLAWGTLGIAPVGQGVANVTVVVGEAEGSRVAGAREAYYDRIIALNARLRGAARVSRVLATGPFDWPIRSAVADGALLVGDAAGYYDPFTGQGIFRALRGAALAAEAADDALRAGDVSARRLQPYEKARRSAFGPGATLQRIIEQFTSRGPLIGLAAERLRRRPDLADALVAVTGDLLPVRTLLAARVIAGLLA